MGTRSPIFAAVFVLIPLIGFSAEAGSAWFLPKLVGLPQALRWCLSGRIFDADEAKAGGLVSEVVEPSELLNRAREIAREMTEATSAVVACKPASNFSRAAGSTSPFSTSSDSSAPSDSALERPRPFDARFAAGSRMMLPKTERSRVSRRPSTSSSASPLQIAARSPGVTGSAEAIEERLVQLTGKLELEGDGVFLDHATRYEQSAEFIRIWREILARSHAALLGPMFRIFTVLTPSTPRTGGRSPRPGAGHR